MRIDGTVALVTGAGRGIGREFVLGLLTRGAAKVYAAGRGRGGLDELARTDPAVVPVVPVVLDVTDAAAVAATAHRCVDVELLVNNAGVNHLQGVIAAPDLAAAEREMRTNYFGPLLACRAFAPVLAANGGGAIVNVLSILARVPIPACGSAAASKAAALSLTQSVRAELAAQGTRVVAVLPGTVDTDMMRAVAGPKMAPAPVVAATLDALARGLAADPKAVEKELARMLPM